MVITKCNFKILIFYKKFYNNFVFKCNQSQQTNENKALFKMLMSNALASQQQSSSNNFIYNSMLTNWLNNNNNNNNSYEMTGKDLGLANESIGSNKKPDQSEMFEIKTPCN